MIGLCQESKGSPEALWRSAGVNSFGFLAAGVGLSAVFFLLRRTRLPFAGAVSSLPRRLSLWSPAVSKLINGSIGSLRSFAQSD